MWSLFFLISGLKDLEAKYNVVSILLLVSSTFMLKISEKKNLKTNKEMKRNVSMSWNTNVQGKTLNYTDERLCREHNGTLPIMNIRIIIK